jgi:hypothetical protein
LYPLTKYRFGKDNLAFTGANMTEVNLNTMRVKLTPFELMSLQHNLKITPYFYHQCKESLDSNNKQSELGVDMKYYTFYPILKLNISARKRKLLQPMSSFWHGNFALGIDFPYYFYLGSSFGEAVCSATALLQPYKKSRTLKYRFTIGSFSTQSERDLHAPWSQKFSIQIKDSSTKAHAYTNKLMHIFGFDSFFPGIGSHHYLQICPVYMHNYTYYKVGPFTDVAEKKFTVQSAYGLPLAYSDFGIPLIWFLKRVSIEGYHVFSISSKDIYYNNIEYLRTIAVHQPPNYANSIGIKLFFLSNVLSLSPSFIKCLVRLNFDFTKQQNYEWKFSFVPEVSFAP